MVIFNKSLIMLFDGVILDKSLMAIIKKRTRIFEKSIMVIFDKNPLITTSEDNQRIL